MFSVRLDSGMNKTAALARALSQFGFWQEQDGGTHVFSVRLDSCRNKMAAPTCSKSVCISVGTRWQHWRVLSVNSRQDGGTHMLSLRLGSGGMLCSFT